MIRWYRNNQPIKKAKYYEMSQSNGEAILRINKCYQDDVAEYKCEASNRAGKATSVASLLLQRKSFFFFSKFRRFASREIKIIINIFLQQKVVL